MMNKSAIPSLKKDSMWKRLRMTPWFISFSSSIFTIILGLIAGLILLIVINPAKAFSAFGILFVGGFDSAHSIAQFIYLAPPILMTGLSIAFAFKTGLFNIGTPGQFLAGTFMALVGAIVWNCPWYINILLAMIGGAIWGFIPGLCKAFFNVNEVLSAIMLNWIAIIIVDVAISNIPSMIDPVYATRTVNIANVNASGIIPGWGLENFDSGLNISIFLAIIFAIVCWIIINKTNFGFELKACGSNKFASKYAGISDKKNIVLSFVIAGALAGIGGAFQYLAPTATGGYSLQISSLPEEGFTGISVGLLAASNPIGCIFAALFISYLDVSGEAIQQLRYAPENVSFIIGIIVYFASFVALVRIWLQKVYKKELFRFIGQMIVKFCKWVKTRFHRGKVIDAEVGEVSSSTQKKVDEVTQKSDDIHPLENKKEEETK
ncbi:MAG: ABC transporter permease [Bacilli bacterium]|nr:ABC transporter permease [Bacilli bacterium]